MIESVINEAIRRANHRALKTLADIIGSGEPAGPPPPPPEEVEQSKKLSAQLVQTMELMVHLRKKGVLVGSSKGMTLAPWVLEAAELRRQPDGPPDPKTEAS